MECIIGIKFRDFVILAADMTNARSLIVMKADENKMHKLSDHLVMGVTGEAGDAVQFAEYIAKNIQLYKMRNSYNLSPDSAAHFTRRFLGDALRSTSAYKVNMMIAGYDETTGPHLYFMDFLASLVTVKYAAHGFGGFFSLAILDRYYLETLDQKQAYELMKKCVKEVRERLIINLANFKVQIVDKNGVHDLPPITASDIAKEHSSMFSFWK